MFRVFTSSFIILLLLLLLLLLLEVTGNVEFNAKRGDCGRPILGAAGMTLTGIGDAERDKVACCDLERKGAMRGESDLSHSFHRAGQPL